MITTTTATQTETPVSQSSNKITIGFKANPELKLALSNAAQELNLTLSAYVEMIVANNYNSLEKDANINELKARIDFYENRILQDLFKKYRGQTLDFVNSDGCPMSITINTLQDTYNVIINCFKTNSND